jgi:hypothetical protein
MALLTAGYWPATYWPSSYWDDNYWPEYAYVEPELPPRPSTPGGGGVAINLSPNFPYIMRTRRRGHPRIQCIDISDNITYVDTIEQFYARDIKSGNITVTDETPDIEVKNA